MLLYTTTSCDATRLFYCLRTDHLSKHLCNRAPLLYLVSPLDAPEAPGAFSNILYLPSVFQPCILRLRHEQESRLVLLQRTRDTYQVPFHDPRAVLVVELDTRRPCFIDPHRQDARVSNLEGQWGNRRWWCCDRRVSEDGVGGI